MSFLNENGVARLWANVVTFVTQSIQAILTNIYTKDEVNNTFITKNNADQKFATIETTNALSNSVSNKADKATTLKGYGITDAYTKTEVNTELNKKANVATTLSGYGITDAYTKTNADQKFATIETTNALSNSVSNKADKATTYTKDEINGKLTGALHYKRSYTTLEELNSAVAASDRAQGDVYNITTAGGTDAHGTAIKAGDNVIWNGTGWDASSGTMDLSAYSTKEEVDAVNEALATKIQIVRWGEND